MFCLVSEDHAKTKKIHSHNMIKSDGFEIYIIFSPSIPRQSFRKFMKQCICSPVPILAKLVLKIRKNRQ